MPNAQLEAVIRYQKSLLQSARILDAIGSITLQELTIKYLEELRSIKEKGVK